VLLADPASGRVAAAHAGWRGIVAGVLASAVRYLAGAPGAGPSSGFAAAIGPCIGACCFEVGEDVASTIAGAVAGDGASVVARRDGARGKAFVDLRRAARVQLVELGFDGASIDDVPSAEEHVGCTRCDAERFYSFRRDGDRSGRLLGVIVAR
jgi:copper oxidase (laccase) domain-containing protein